jgi:RNA polymerase sigma-70 factor (ECF subfamily)
MEIQGTAVGIDIHQAHAQRLLERMSARDEAALSEFYDLYHRLVYSLVLRVLGSAVEAEDVVVDVFWQVWRQAGQYDPARGKAFTWLMTMTRTRAIDRRRGLQRQDTLAQAMASQQQQAVESVADPEENLFVAERRRRVRAALDTLPEAQRRAVELAYYGGLSQSEIAMTLNEPLGTVKTRIRTGLARLREELASYLC